MRLVLVVWNSSVIIIGTRPQLLQCLFLLLSVPLGLDLRPLQPLSFLLNVLEHPLCLDIIIMVVLWTTVLLPLPY